LVADALKGLGISLYTNTSVSDNVYYSLFGINQDGSLLPPTGSEVITSYVTSSLQTLASDTIEKEVYKRIYHNLPYLLKSRGTQRGVKALLSTFGIPDSILNVNEFGGYDRSTKDGIYEINNDKVIILSGSYSASLSSSLLSPETTIQYYSNENRLNVSSVEVGFSPANSINAVITGSLGYFSIDQYIGNPSYSTSGSYPALDALRKSTFQSLTGSHSINEYIRLIKYYNNSVFKMIKDFVPAKSSVSTGLIVKSHILERNKYARYEPSSSFDNNLSQSIELLTITGSAANSISGSTAWANNIITIAGVVPYSSSQEVEKFTGEFSGSVITATTLTTFAKQYEISQNFTVSASGFVTQSLGATYQNVTGSVRSKKYFDLDYTSNQSTPINYGIVTQSISASQVPGYDNNAAFNNPNIPYAELQDSNYALQSFTIPRYYGSKTISATYNDYTIGDSSYGSTAAIDKIKYQYGYLVDMYSSSFQLPNRVNAQIKYMLDNNQNVLDLTKANANISTTQNVFMSGEPVNISLFNYDPNNNMAQYLTNNQNVNIYEGGFRYSPILHSTDGSNNNKVYSLNTPIEVYSTTSSPAYTYLSPTDQGYWGAVTVVMTAPPGLVLLNFTASAKVTPDATQDTWVTVSVTNLTQPGLAPYDEFSYTKQISAVQSSPFYYSVNLPSSPYSWLPGDTVTTEISYEYFYFSSGSSVSSSAYQTSVTDSDSRLYAEDSRTIRLSATQSLYYNQFIELNTAAGLETPISNFSLSQMDLVRLNNTTSSWGKYNESEYRVNNIYAAATSSVTFWYFTLDRDLNPKDTDIDTIPGYISKYIVLKRSPDETNLILAFSGSSNITDDGLIFPKYIDPIVRENSGNVIKSLKQQNLI